MSKYEFILNLIEDINDQILDYKDDLERGRLTRIETYETKIRIDELKRMRTSLKELAEEYKDE